MSFVDFTGLSLGNRSFLTGLNKQSSALSLKAIDDVAGEYIKSCNIQDNLYTFLCTADITLTEITQQNT